MTKSVTIDASPRLHRFYVDEILAIKAHGNYSAVWMTDGKDILVTRQIGKIRESLEKQCNDEEPRFAKLGKSLIVNLEHVFEIELGKKPRLTLRSHKDKVCKTFEAPKDALRDLYDCLKSNL